MYPGAMVGDVAAYSLRDTVRVDEPSPREDHGKLFAAVTRRDVYSAHASSDQLRRLAKHPVAGLGTRKLEEWRREASTPSSHEAFVIVRIGRQET